MDITALSKCSFFKAEIYEYNLYRKDTVLPNDNLRLTDSTYRNGQSQEAIRTWL